MLRQKGFGVIVPNGSDYDIAATSTFDNELCKLSIYFLIRMRLIHVTFNF